MTIPKECKRLAEVDFPVAAISKNTVGEKSIRILLFLSIVLCGVLLVACAPSEVNPGMVSQVRKEEFQPIVNNQVDQSTWAFLESIKPGDINPIPGLAYWEWRQDSWGPIAVGGELGFEQLDPATAQAVLAVLPETGFGPDLGALGDIIYHFAYIIAVDEEGVKVWNTIDDLRRFLGDIDTPQEAILLALAHDYFIEAYRQDDSGYTLYGQESWMGSSPSCMGGPVRFVEYLVLLKVSHTGDIEVQSRKKVAEYCGMF